MHNLLPLSSFMLVVMLGCGPVTKPDSSQELKVDTVALLQTVLDYPEIKNDFMYFPGQSIKLVQSKVVRPTYQLLYRSKPVDIVQLKEEGSDIGKVYPKQFYVGLSALRVFAKDSAQLVYITYAGSSTSVFNLKMDDCSWKIMSVDHGKY